MANDEYMKRILANVSATLKSSNKIDIINDIATKNKDFASLSVQDQYLLGAILGSLLHESYCNSRKLDKPNSQGLPNNPRIKQLTSNIDKDFTDYVIKNNKTNGKTLFMQNGVLCMDIANTPFEMLSPYWQKDNFMAGCAATRSVISNWDGLTHNNETVREFVTIAVANAIHEAWIARENIYYETQNGNVFTNEELATAYINLPKNEQDKDLLHYKMALDMTNMLFAKMNGNNIKKSQNSTIQENF